MPTAKDCLEIINLGNGEVVLQRTDENGSKPLVRIQFSDETINYLMDNSLEVATAMIQTAIHLADDLVTTPEVEFETAEAPANRILH